MNSFDDFPPLPPLGSAFSPEPAPYYWQDTTPSAAVASAGYPLLLADSPRPPNDSMEEHDSNYDHEAFLAMFEEIINSDCIQPETSRPGSPMLSGIINDALQAVHEPVTQLDTAEPNSPHHDNLRRASASPRARLTPASFSPSPARSVFAHLVSPPQERAPEAAIEHDHFSPDALLTPTVVPEPAFPPYPFGPPYHSASPTRGYKRDRGPESAPRSEDRTSKRPRVAGSSSQRDRVGSPLGPIASSSSSSRLANSHRASVSNIENARTSPARSPLRIWGVPPSTPVREQTSVHNAVEDRDSLVARTNTPSAPAPVPTSVNRSPLAATSRTNTPPSSTPAPAPERAPLPTGARTYLELAGYPEHVRDLPEEFYYDIRCIGAELVPQGLSPATWVAPAPSSVKSRDKGKGKAAATTKVTKAKKPQKDKKKPTHKYQYFCPFYNALEFKTKTRSPGNQERVLFTVASPNIPGAAAASRLVSCTRREPFPRQADALRHALNKHIEPRTYCIERFNDADSRVCSSFNRPDSVKRHLRDTCMVEQFPLLVHDTAARLGLTLDSASPDPRVRTQSKRNWAACEALVARERTRIVMPCYQKPAVRAAVGTYLRWRGKNLEWFEEDQRAVAIEFERCPCAACQVPEQEWAEEWVRGRIDVPVWYGEQRVTVEAGVSGKRGRRRQVEEADDDDEDDVDAGGDEEELEDHDADEDSAGPTPRAVDAEDDDRLSPEPEEGVDEDEDEAPVVLLAPAPTRPVEPAEPSIVASEERTLSHPAAQPGPSPHAQAAAPPVVQEQRGQSRPALDYAPSTSTPSRPVSLHTGVPWMESPLEVYQRIYGNVPTLLAPVSAVVASSSMAPPSPDDGVDWGSLFN